MHRGLMWALCVVSLALSGQDAPQANATPAESKPAPDVLAIVRRSIDRDAKNFERYRDYTYEETFAQYRYDSNGGLNGTPDRETSDVLMLAGQPYSRQIAHDGKPLSEKDAQKEQEKMDKELAKRLKDPEKQQARYNKEFAEQRRFLRELPDAFTFTLLGEETMAGLPVWKIHAEPLPDFKAHESRAETFKKVRGTIWIDQAGYQWVRADLEVIDTISWGFFVLRIPPGATISFTQMRVNQEVWMPESLQIRADARIAFLKTIHAGIEITYRNYRKFSAESKVVGVEEVPPEPRQ